MIGCPAYKHQHELTTPKFLNTSIALGSKADIFAKDNEIAALNIFTSDFSLHTDLFIYQISWYGCSLILICDVVPANCALMCIGVA